MKSSKSIEDVSAGMETRLNENSIPDSIKSNIEAPPVESGLSSGVQFQMAGANSTDFLNVKVHQNSLLAKEIGARAYTQGNNVHFAPGQYDPNSQSGRELIGHELTHVKQQREGRVQPTTQAGGLPANDDKELEKEADDQGKKTVQVKPASESAFQKKGHITDVSFSNSPKQFRVSTFTSLEAVFKNAILSIPENVVIDMISRALLRMKQDKQLLSNDPVPDIIKKIFPAPGVIVEAEFNKAVDVANRDRIYMSVSDTNSPLKKKDRPKLKAAMDWAVQIVRLAESSSYSAAVKRVFGTKTPTAQTNYKKAGDELVRLKASDAAMDAGINTDYNRDDPAMGLGGWAGGGVIHLQSDIAEVKDNKDTVVTLIHEASHLSSNAVTDLGYYPPSTDKGTFSAMPEDTKVNNAAHYEEFPRRWLGISKYKSTDVFTPGVVIGGGALTPEDKARDEVSQYFRKAWDAGVDAQFGLRDRRKEILGGDNTKFLAHKAEILSYSKLAGLSIHQQKAGNETVTDLDVTLAEGVPREALRLKSSAKKLVISVPIAADADVPAAKEQLIKDAIKANNTLLGDVKKDRDLLDYLESHFHGIPFNV